MSLISSDQIEKALQMVKVPGDASDIVTLGMVSGVSVTDTPQGAQVTFTIEVDPRLAATLEPLRGAAEQAVLEIPGVISASAVLTAHKAPPAALGNRHRQKLVLPGVKRIIAIASGKGGVGKSTTAVNLAVAMMLDGLKVGLLDADIYGPSIPRMLKLTGKPLAGNDKKLIPHRWNNLSVMSMGFLIADDTPMIWRGPMVHSAITQLFRDVAWGDLDVLIADLPPGTGDAQLTMAQQVPLSGAIIVSTPQDIALIDARKGLLMFERVDVPVLGIIENMSYFTCPHCGERSDIFSYGGARREARNLNVPFLGEIPLDILVREMSDAGDPITHSQPNGKLANVYREIARGIWKILKV